MQHRKFRSINLLIHVFALAHALTALLLWSTAFGDEIPLTILTIVMIIAIGGLYHSPLEVSAAMALLGCFAGFYLGTEGHKLIESLTLLSGNYASAITTLAVTEILGWVTFTVLKPKKLK